VTCVILHSVIPDAVVTVNTYEITRIPGCDGPRVGRVNPADVFNVDIKETCPLSVFAERIKI
jgi:hypothetical protein